MLDITKFKTMFSLLFLAGACLAFVPTMLYLCKIALGRGEFYINGIHRHVRMNRRKWGPAEIRYKDPKHNGGFHDALK